MDTTNISPKWMMAVMSPPLSASGAADTGANDLLGRVSSLRDIVRCFEDTDHGTVVHQNLGLWMTVLSVNQRHLQDARKD
jgi:hypothetical protein